MKRYKGLMASSISLAALSSCLISCNPKEEASTSSGGYEAEQVAEALYTVLKADRTIYAKKVVSRLVNTEGVITAHEEWKEKKALLLPAQFFREGAELVDEVEDKPFDFSYSLQSKWPLNMTNAEKQTPAVKQGLEAVSDPENDLYGKKWTGEEEIAGQNYFVGIYPDRAVAPACWECHNDHSNRKPEYPEFKKGDVMGGIVIRIPIAQK